MHIINIFTNPKTPFDFSFLLNHFGPSSELFRHSLFETILKFFLFHTSLIPFYQRSTLVIVPLSMLPLRFGNITYMIEISLEPMIISWTGLPIMTHVHST